MTTISGTEFYTLYWLFTRGGCVAEYPKKAVDGLTAKGLIEVTPQSEPGSPYPGIALTARGLQVMKGKLEIIESRKSRDRS